MRFAIFAVVATTVASQPHWSETCRPDIEKYCQKELEHENCAEYSSGQCKSDMFNCIDIPGKIELSKPCQDAVDARNQKAIDDAAAEAEAAASVAAANAAAAAAALPPAASQPAPMVTCPLPAMHIRSARAVVKCATFKNKNQFPQLSNCNDANLKQNFALVPSPDGVKVIFSPSQTEILCMNKVGKLAVCDETGGESFSLIRTWMQSVQLKAASGKCLAAKGLRFSLADCVNPQKGKANKAALRAQSFYIEPTIGA